MAKIMVGTERVLNAGAILLLSVISAAGDFLEDFETGRKTAYPGGSVVCSEGSWYLENSLIDPIANDKKNDLQSVRSYGTLYMEFDKLGGVGEVSLYHGRYGTDSMNNMSWRLAVSDNGGASWDAYLSDPITASNDWQQITFTDIDIPGPIRVRVDVSGGSKAKRINFDDIAISDYSGPEPDNYPPYFIDMPLETEVDFGTTFCLEVNITDIDGYITDVSAASPTIPDAGDLLTGTASSNTWNGQWIWQTTQEGTHSLTFTAVDDSQTTNSHTLLLTVASEWLVKLRPGQEWLEDFNNMEGGLTTKAQLPIGWSVTHTNTVRALTSFCATNNTTTHSGGVDMSDRANAGIYNFGAGVSDKAEDRAIGFLSSKSNYRSGNLMVACRNIHQSEPIHEFELGYSIEKYRAGSNERGFEIKLYTSRDGVNWSAAGAEWTHHFPPDPQNAGYPEVPAETRIISGTLPDSALLPGERLYICWNYSVADGPGTTLTSNAIGLGIDDVRLKARTSPRTILLIR